MNLNPNLVKEKLLNDLFDAVQQVGAKHLELIKSNKSVDYRFHHEMLYDLCKKEFPNLPSNTIQLIRDEIIARYEKDNEIVNKRLFAIPILLSPQSFKIEKAKSSSFFNAWFIFKKLAFPLEGKEVIDEIEKMGLFSIPAQESKKEELEELIQSQTYDNKHGHKDFSKSNNSSKSYRVIRAFIKRDFKKKIWKLYLNIEVKKPFKPNVPLEVEQKQVTPFEKNTDIKTTFTHVTHNLSKITNKPLPKPVNVLRISSKKTGDEYLDKLLNRPEFVVKLFDGFRTELTSAYVWLHNLLNWNHLECFVHSYT
jgi:hypothetical protein